MTKSYAVYPFTSFRAGSEPCRRAGTQRIALRTGGSANTNLKWLLGDHLGSTSVTADYAGTLLSRTLYKPLHSIQGRLWGEVRYQSGALPTKYTYTGQYSHTADFGLMYYVARWYDPVLGRFAQADSLAPGAGNPRAWDRYAYALNAPVGHVDPSGHRTCTAEQAATGDETCDQNIMDDESESCTIPGTPPDLGDGCEWVLSTPNGEGVVSWYEYPIRNDPKITEPNDLPDQDYLRMQGSVKLNGSNWSWNGGAWVPSAGPCTPPYGSSTQCVIPFESAKLNPKYTTTGAVKLAGLSYPLSGIGYYIPIDENATVYIQVPNGNPGDPLIDGLVVNTRDGCPGCTVTQVDILTTNIRNHYGYNQGGKHMTNVYIWIRSCPPEKIRSDVR